MRVLAAVLGSGLLQLHGTFLGHNQRTVSPGQWARSEVHGERTGCMFTLTTITEHVHVQHNFWYEVVGKLLRPAPVYRKPEGITLEVLFVSGQAWIMDGRQV